LRLEDLDEFIIEDIEGLDHPSDFIKRDNYAVLILRLPQINNSIDIVSFAFIIENSSVYTYDRETKSLNKFGSLDDLVEFLNIEVEKLISKIKIYHSAVDNLEESIYESRLRDNFMQEWLSYKKDVSLINRLMFHSSITLDQFLLYLKKDLGYENIIAYEDVKEEAKRVYDLSKAAIDKLDNLYNFHRAKVDEKMNKNVYYLTLLSGIFLPLSLATGFFGMNTGGLPYTDDPNGTLKVVLISLILEILFFFPFIFQNFKKIKRFRK